MFNKTTSRIEITLGISILWGRNGCWTESLEPQGADVIGRYADTFRKGQPVMARHPVGQGCGYCLGTYFEDSLLSNLLAAIAGQHGLRRAPFQLAPGTEAIRRLRGDHDLYFLFNYRQQESVVQLDRPFRNELTDKPMQGVVHLAAKEYMVLE